MATPSPPIRPSPSSSVESEKKWAIVVEAPHVCVWPEYADRNCDMRTDDFARRLHAQLRELQKENDFDYSCSNPISRVACAITIARSAQTSRTDDACAKS